MIAVFLSQFTPYITNLLRSRRHELHWHFVPVEGLLAVALLAAVVLSVMVHIDKSVALADLTAHALGRLA